MGRLNRKQKKVPIGDRIAFIKRLTKPVEEDQGMGERERTLAKVVALKKIKHIGGWEFEKTLMSAALSFHPAQFSGLVEADMDKCIIYGNKKLVEMGMPTVITDPSVDEGVCIDLWAESDEPLPGAPDDEPEVAGWKRPNRAPVNKFKAKPEIKFQWKEPSEIVELEDCAPDDEMITEDDHCFFQENPCKEESLVIQEIGRPTEIRLTAMDYGEAELRIDGNLDIHQEWATRQLSSEETEAITSKFKSHDYGEFITKTYDFPVDKKTE